LLAPVPKSSSFEDLHGSLAFHAELAPEAMAIGAPGCQPPACGGLLPRVEEMVRGPSDVWRPAERKNPLRRSEAGKSGTKAERLAFIKEVWAEMRALSVRRLTEGRNTPSSGRPISS